MSNSHNNPRHQDLEGFVHHWSKLGDLAPNFVTELQEGPKMVISK